MSGAIDFVIAARNAGRNADNDQARAKWAREAEGLRLPIGSDAATLTLCEAIRSALRALPHLAIGSRAPAGRALQQLGLSLDIHARVFSLANSDPHTEGQGLNDAPGPLRGPVAGKGDGDAAGAGDLLPANPSAGAGARNTPAPDSSDGEEMRRYWIDTQAHQHE